MANNNVYGSYDPRYDPRYQQQPQQQHLQQQQQNPQHYPQPQAYGYPRPSSVEVRVPTIANPYQAHPQFPVPPQVQQHNYQQVQANHGYHQPYNPYMQRPPQPPPPAPPQQQQQQQQQQHPPPPQMQMQHPMPLPQTQRPMPPVQVQVPQYQHQYLQQQQSQHQHQQQQPQHQHQHQHQQQHQQHHHQPQPQHQQLNTPSPRMHHNGYPSPKPRPTSAQAKAQSKPRPTPPQQTVSTPKPSPKPKPEPKPEVKPKVKPKPKPPPPPAEPPPSVDHTPLLVDLAEQYFQAAYGNKDVARVRDEETFRKLISTGLACLEAPLREHKTTLQPALEASIRLRYASVLYQETENSMEAEEALVKGISICERYKLTDLKYNMQHLQARIMHSKSRKAGIVFLDGVIKDVEAIGHIPWIYAFRLLRVSLALQSSQTQEILNAITQLKLIANMANSRGDHAVSVLASSLEALVHTNRSINLDGIEQAQRALAAARSSQFEPLSQKIPQLGAIAFYVDLSCSIHQGDTAQASSKLAAMQTFFDSRQEDPGWTDDGSFAVPIGEASSSSLQSGTSQGVVRSDSDGRLSVQVQWLSKSELYAIGYTFCAAALINKNAMDGHKSEAFIKAAADVLSRDEDEASMSDIDKVNRSILRCHLQAQLVFAQCLRSDWPSASHELKALREQTKALPVDASSKFEAALQFLEASIAQGTGDTEHALSIYGRPTFTLSSRNTQVNSPFHHNLSILAALNTLLIINDSSHRTHSQTSSILQTVEPIALESPSKDLQAAYYLIRAVSANANALEHSSMISTKQNLQHALQAAKHSANNQLCCITLNFMSWKFFRGVVGEQPKKSALSGQQLAKKGQSNLWLSVADGLLAETLETQGMSLEAERAKKEGVELASQLPASMQREEERTGLGGLEGTFLT